jgi:hypothetical protein
MFRKSQLERQGKVLGLETEQDAPTTNRNTRLSYVSGLAGLSGSRSNAFHAMALNPAVIFSLQ